MMPAVTYQIPGGSRVIVTTCDDCGDPAPYGFNVNLRAALAATTPVEAVRRLGRWCCGRSPDGAPQCKRWARGIIQGSSVKTDSYDVYRDNPPQALKRPKPKTNSMAREASAANGSQPSAGRRADIG